MSALAAPVANAKPTYFVHGFEWSSNSDCGNGSSTGWSPMINAFRDHWGHTSSLLKIKYYHADYNCNKDIASQGSHSTHYGTEHHNGSHTTGTDIRHLGYHLAWQIYNQYTKVGTPIDIVAHSMGGLIVRYAIAQVQKGHSSFPPSLLVEDVVTMGTPHGGATSWSSACAINCPHQVNQMKPGSDFLVWLESNAWNPQGTGGTEWTTMGAHDDNLVPADRAAATDSDREPFHMYMGSCIKVWYGDASNIDHNNFRTERGADASASARQYERVCGWGSWIDYLGAWPVRRADLAVRYAGW